MHIGERIKALREEKGLTKADLQRITGIHRSTISLVESGGIKCPNVEHVLKLAEALDVDPGELLHVAGHPRSNGRDDLVSGKATLALSEMAALPLDEQDRVAGVLRSLLDWHRVRAHNVLFSTAEAQTLVMRLARLPEDEQARVAKLMLWVLDLCESGEHLDFAKAQQVISHRGSSSSS